MSQEFGTTKFCNMSHEEAVPLYVVATGAGCQVFRFY